MTTPLLGFRRPLSEVVDAGGAAPALMFDLIVGIILFVKLELASKLPILDALLVLVVQHVQRVVGTLKHIISETLEKCSEQKLYNIIGLWVFQGQVGGCARRFRKNEKLFNFADGLLLSCLLRAGYQRVQEVFHLLLHVPRYATVHENSCPASCLASVGLSSYNLMPLFHVAPHCAERVHRPQRSCYS